MIMQHVEGQDKGKLVLFALSTCGWCKKTRALIEDLNVDYEYVYVDLLNGKEREEVVEMVKKWNPQVSFPTLIINDSKTIIGFKEDEIKEAIE
ncbi:glutaredoxin family protein [Methanobacterium sp. SMA-27]|uniref:glutaredoxin family protein n=1 Tax=Methanobacterium sp. SMA-27 TaxID=1495336 RepID=UPI00064FB58C|nr:glutaredoxin family protein [Methanobacterium sp. SMA-27]